MHEPWSHALPDELAELKDRFILRWTKERSRWKGYELFHQLWPNQDLIQAVEKMFDSARYDGRRGDPFRRSEFSDFSERLPASPLPTINISERFLHLAYRQYQIGRAQLVKVLLAKHETQRQRERHGLA